MDRISKFNVVHRFEKRSLLALINSVAGLSIFFFGYDQGLMGGVVTNRDYAETMGFGVWDGDQVQVTKPLLKGGIVSGFNRLCSNPFDLPRSECGILPTGHSCWLPLGWLDR